MTTAKDVLKAARSQIGVTESPANSNKTKYGKQYGSSGLKEYTKREDLRGSRKSAGA